MLRKEGPPVGLPGASFFLLDFAYKPARTGKNGGTGERRRGKGRFACRSKKKEKGTIVVPFSCFREKGLKNSGRCGFYKYKSCGDRPFRRGAGSRRNRKNRSGILPVQNTAGQRGGGDDGRRFQSWHCSRIARATISVPSAAVAAQFLRKVSALAASVSNSA